MSNTTTGPQVSDGAANPQVTSTPPTETPIVKQGTSVAAIIGLVFAILALITSLIPIINNVAFFGAILGVIFALIGFIQTGPSKPKGGRGVAIAGLVIAIVSIVAVLASQSFYGAVLDEAVNEAGLGETRTVENVDDITIDNVSVANDYNGNPFALVTYSWTNSGENTSDKAGAFFTTYAETVYQDGVECERGIYYKSTSDNTDYYGDQKEVQVGATQTFTAAYELASTSSPVHITVTGWIGTGNVYVDQEFDIA